METTRRDFLERIATGTLMLGGAPIAIGYLNATAAAAIPGGAAQQGQKWDLSWTTRVTGKHKAVLDVPEIDSGYGVWRASIWAQQYQEALGAAPKDTTSVLVLRHNGIWLGLEQSFWDKYGIGKDKNAMHPVTEQPTDRNPALLSSTRNEVPAMFDPLALDKFLERKGIVLGCNLAFADVIEKVKSKDGVGDEAAAKVAMDALLPGIVLQPSGIFAVIRAQEAGCTYVRAS